MEKDNKAAKAVAPITATRPRSLRSALNASKNPRGP